MSLFRRPFERLPDTQLFAIHLHPSVRAVLASLPEQLRQLLADDSPSLERLFPPTYLSDPDKQAEYQRFMRDELVSSRLASADILEQTATSATVSEVQLHAWMRAVNDVRLILGTTLDVGEDDSSEFGTDDPRSEAMELYELLGWLLHHMIEEMSGATSGDGDNSEGHFGGGSDDDN